MEKISTAQSKGSQKKLTRASSHTGEKYAFLTVLSPAEMDNGVRMYSCQCVCGSVKSYNLNDIRRGTIISCGCMDYTPFTDISIFPKAKQEKILSRVGTKQGDLTILAFNHWLKVPWYRMRCVCGKEAVFPYATGLQSCGCRRMRKQLISDPMLLRKPWPARFREDQGKVFGKLTVEAYEYMKHNEMYCRCRCACGNTCVVLRNSLLDGAVISCGCDPYGYAGQQFGWLTAIRYEDGAWLCRCKCGNEIRVSTRDLRTGTTRSCGCMRKARDKGLELMNNVIDNTNPDLALRVVRNAFESRDEEVMGILFRKGKYDATLIFQKKRYYLGRFETLEEAVAARRAAVKKYVVPWVENFQKNLAEDYYAGMRARYRETLNEQGVEPRKKGKTVCMRPTPVAQYTMEGDLVRVYANNTEASQITGYSRHAIAKAAKGRWKTCGGYIWKYAEPQEEQP